MRFFGRPTSSQDRETDALLDALGEAERAAPMARPGSFEAIQARLKPGSEPAVRWRPMFALGGGAALLAVTVAVGVLMQDRATPTEEIAATRMPASASAAAVPDIETIDRGVFSNRRQAGDLTVTADSVFLPGNGVINRLLVNRNFGTVPFLVTIKNNGKPFTGQIEVQTGAVASDMSHIYRYPVAVAGNGAVTRKIVYPALSTDWPRNQFELRFDTGKNSLVVAGNQISGGQYNGSAVLGMIDERIGMLQHRRNAGNTAVGQYTSFYVKPWNAPDRATGYESIDMLVLGRGARTLNPAQWSAIREWVKDGGQLIFLGGAEMTEVLQNPVARELNPMARFHVSAEETTVDAAKADAETIVLNAQLQVHRDRWGTKALRRRFGAGMVIDLGVDPTTPAFRSNGSTVENFWNEVATLEQATPLGASTIRSLAGENPWIGYLYIDRGGAPYTYARDAGRGEASDDPFRMTLPPLQTVLYVFLGYFILVVPLSFVVLKQTRRMQYAWFTGPIAAVAFAGGLALFTTNLYRAPLSRRTAGIVAMAAGEGRARFHGFTELYVPRGGRYTLEMPGTERVVDRTGTSDSYGSTGGSFGEITTTDDGTGEKPITVDVPNLSFRRVFHHQTVSLGEGVTADLRIAANGDLVGTVSNRTGLTLKETRVMVREPKSKTGRSRGNTYEYFPVRTYTLGTLAPGEHTVRETAILSAGRDDRLPAEYESLPALQQCAQIWQVRGVTSEARDIISTQTPLLVAQTSGDTFGPRSLGRWIGGDESVGVLVRLPLITRSTTASTITTEGGAAR